MVDRARPSPNFSPIAIVGRACLLPGAMSPEALSSLVFEARDEVSSVPDGRWRLARERVLADARERRADRAFSDRGGYVREEPELPRDLALSRDELARLDPIVRWLASVGRAALLDAKGGASRARTGLVVGNLSFPTDHLAAFAARVWLEGTAFGADAEIDPRDRFMSGLSARLAASALGLGGPVHALDAACASSLYAIAEAAGILARGEADTMIAGAVNRADDLFIHIGFSALQAMSKTGRSRPFHRDADGLVPAEGCALVVLRRLDDAIRDGERILGVIRGVGLANDGRARGLLVPSEEGQARAMRAAYAEAGLSPADVDYVECHATGTSIGDATELRSLRAVRGEASGPPTPIGSFKANVGHLVTVAGVAGLLKVLAAFERESLPPTPHLDAASVIPAAAELGFEVVTAPRPWPRRDPSTPRRAAVSAFGFGGNDAHLVVEEWIDPASAPRTARSAPSVRRVAIVDLEARVGALPDAAAWSAALAARRSLTEPRADGSRAAMMREVVLELEGLRFPPTDLARAIAQQTSLLGAARELAARHEAWLTSDALLRERTAVLVGMGADADVARWGARWRLGGEASRRGLDEAWIARASDAIAPSLDAATVIGTMPNVPANRINSQLDLGGPSHTVSAEEASGLVALELARAWLLEGRIDAALVGASDLCVEPVHERAARALLPAALHVPGDASVVLLVVREEDALARRLPILAVLDEEAAFDASALRFSVVPREGARSLVTESGHAHAASGLLHVAAAALALSSGEQSASHARIECSSLGGAGEVVGLARSSELPIRTIPPTPAPRRALRLAAHPPRPLLPEPTMPERSPRHAHARSARDDRGADAYVLPAAPRLPSVRTFERRGAPSAPHVEPPAHPSPEAPAPTAAWARPSASIAASSAPRRALEPAPARVTDATAPAGLVAEGSAALAWVGAQRAISLAHQRFIADQLALHDQFLAMRARSMGLLAHASSLAPREAWDEALLPALPTSAAPVLVAELAPPPARAITPRTIERPAEPTGSSPVASAPASSARSPSPPIASAPAPRAARSLPAKKGGLTPDPVVPIPRGPSFDRAELAIHAGGSISAIFGPLFQQQDGYAIQTRMPMEPMLLADRATGLDAEPGVLGKGTTWTETDVTWESWYLHEGRMPGGVLIESGQADLFLISYMGIDFLNRGDRAYRLLGCELTYHRSPPRAGETIDYDIHVDGHANQGPIRIFFFHYDCRARPLGTPGPGPGYEGKPLLTVRGGQAGFFTKRELAESAGILWRPEEQEIVDAPRLDPPAVATKSRFSFEDLTAFSEGRVVDCFGAAFAPTRSHVRTPRIAGGRMLFLHRVDAFDPKGGPWGRGYLHATQDIHEDDWFFPGHFLNDPCMPGTLMFEGCLQAMALYLTAMGFTLARDGWRFEPITGETYKLLCRGQVIPSSKELTYELFVEEVVAGPVPMLYADVLCKVDGLGAFHARRMGVRLVPAWPLEERPRLLAADALPPPVGEEPEALSQIDPSREVARAPNGPSEGFAFDYASLVACAWGRPSAAFGPIYERFDSTRKVARLPGPPYHFMSRVRRVEGEMGLAKAGAKVEVEYDVPTDAWYFRENGARVMPYSVLMEAALQPCGWLASYVGCALVTDEDLLFRNLDGKATAHREITPDTERLVTRAHLKSLSRNGTMIIVAFDVTLHAIERGQREERLAYALDTVFGFFPTSAFENQAGLPVSSAQRALHDIGKRGEIDLDARPARLTTGSARLAAPFLLMLDRVTHADLEGGEAGLGAFRAEKDVDPDEWFFKAHFFQDPVQPGSLGVEAMCQLLQFAMLEEGLAEGMESPRFQAVATGAPHVWKYRGQVVPKNRTIGCTLEVRSIERSGEGVLATADASLWVDGKRIYDAKGLGMRLVDDARFASLPPDQPLERGEHLPTVELRRSSVPSGRASSGGRAMEPVVLEETLDPAEASWLADHAPTWVIPALPAMSMLERVRRAARPILGSEVMSVEGLQILRWVSFAGGAVRLRTIATPHDEGDEPGADVVLEVFREARDPRMSRFEPVASAHATLAGPREDAVAPLEDAASAPSPYADGSLFHGPRFQLLRALEVGTRGARGELRVPSEEGALARELVLDAATHAIPHDALHLWSEVIPADRAAYPYRIERAWLGELPDSGALRVEARLEGVDELAHLRLALYDGERLVADLTLSEVLLPKGPIGTARPADREAFLRDAQYREGVGLSRSAAGVTTLLVRDVALSNWLPGTVERVYRTRSADVAAEIAVKDHLASLLHAHPSRIEVGFDEADRGVASAHDAREPLTRYRVRIERDAERVTVFEGTEPVVELGVVRRFWRSYLAPRGASTGPWPGEDLYFALIERFLRRVVITAPRAFEERLVERSALYLGNHQVGVESLLFGIVLAALTRTPTLTLAKKEHAESWLGRLIRHNFSYPGVLDPEVIAYFDRQDPASLPRILRELGARMRRRDDPTRGPIAGQNVMIHVEGTRSLSCAQPIQRMSGVFVDLALALGVPIVPVRFVGGLPREPLAERLEFPVGMGRQDYYVGAPIEPEALAAMPYKERTELVMRAIDALGPGPASEAPFEADPDFARAATAWSESHGVDGTHAALAEALVRYASERDSAMSEAGRALVRALRSRAPIEGTDAKAAWLEALRATLG